MPLLLLLCFYLSFWPCSWASCLCRPRLACHLCVYVEGSSEPLFTDKSVENVLLQALIFELVYLRFRSFEIVSHWQTILDPWILLLFCPYSSLQAHPLCCWSSNFKAISYTHTRGPNQDHHVFISATIQFPALGHSWTGSCSCSCRGYLDFSRSQWWPDSNACISINFDRKSVLQKLLFNNFSVDFAVVRRQTLKVADHTFIHRWIGWLKSFRNSHSFRRTASPTYKTSTFCNTFTQTCFFRHFSILLSN